MKNKTVRYKNFIYNEIDCELIKQKIMKEILKEYQNEFTETHSSFTC